LNRAGAKNATQLYLKLPSSNTLASFSSDGSWLAYVSAKSKIYEVYVRAFPDKGAEWPISINGGHTPVWSRNGRELFYRTEDGRIMVVTYAVKGDSFVAEKPRQWSSGRLAYSGLNRNFDVAPDGKRLVAGIPAGNRELPNHVLLVVDFFDEVKRRVAREQLK
jgi:Tol biopolymer transport system component